MTTWYSFDGDLVRTHSTEHKARQAAQRALAAARKEAVEDHGWPAETTEIEWGVMVPRERVQVTERGRDEDDTHPHDDGEPVEYGLVPVPPMEVDR